MSMSEAHARLNLRTEVIDIDAVIAILLYEESVMIITGYNLIYVYIHNLFSFKIKRDPPKLYKLI